MHKKYLSKFFFVFQINASELVPSNCPRTAYFSSAVAVLTNSPKIFHVTKKDSFQRNYLHIYQ